ncbi:MAG: low molecular weight protein arginine phosphatase [Elusimicrobiota bacterium]
MQIRKVTFVCTGNTCRSVMAERSFKKMIEASPIESILADSAGTAAMPHYAIIGDLKAVMDEKGIDYSGHKPRLLNMGIMKETDLVLAMTEEHKVEIVYRFPEEKEKVFMLSEYVSGEYVDISDPIGLGVEAYRESFDEISEYLIKLKEKLENEFRNS